MNKQDRILAIKKKQIIFICTTKLLWVSLSSVYHVVRRICHQLQETVDVKDIKFAKPDNANRKRLRSPLMPAKQAARNNPTTVQE